MRELAIPRAERSGQYGVVDVEVGDVRQAIATFSSVATLTRAHVGPRALSAVLPELRTACQTLPSVVARSVFGACDVVALSTGLTDEARLAVDALVAAARQLGTRVLAALDEVENGRSMGARSRLALESVCDRAVEELGQVRAAVELLQQSSTGEPFPVVVGDLLRELRGGEGNAIGLTLSGCLDELVAVHPRVALALVRGMLGCAWQQGFRGAVAHVRRDDRRVWVELAEAPADACELEVLVHAPAPFDLNVLRLAAATLAAEVVPCGAGLKLGLLRV